MVQDNTKLLFVAEISANHLGSKERALEIISSAAISGANAVKFQTYTPNTMTLDIEKFRINSDHRLWGGQKLFELYEKAHTPWDWHSELFDKCRDLGVIPFSTPFDFSAIEFLEAMNCPMYKIASLESGDIPLIKRVAETGKPLIVSTGATEWDEIEELVATVEKTGNQDLTLLVCTSSYPAKPLDAHLRRISTLRNYFGVKVGISDHTLGVGVSIAAIALGASVIEKHLTLRRSDGGADGAFSMEPEEFAVLVQEGTSAFQSLGMPDWGIQDSERESLGLRRSLYVVKDVKAGELVSYNNVKSIRPAGGCAPKKMDYLIGKKFKNNYSIGTPMSEDLVL